MSRSEVAQLELLTAKTNTVSAALKAADGDVRNAGYVTAAALADKIYNKGVKRLRKEAKAEKELTEHEKAIEALDLPGQVYSKVFIFEDLNAANGALRALATDWLTSKSGRHGSNKIRKYHGGPRGCFKITVDKTTLKATLWQAGNNDEDLPASMPGGTPAEEEADTEEEDTASTLGDIGLLFAGGGKTSTEIKAMDKEAQKEHCAKLVKSRDIKAARVQVVAVAAKCPAEITNREKRIEWLFDYILTH